MVRKLDAGKSTLRKRARLSGRQAEAEMRDALRSVVKEEDAPRFGLGTEIARRFAGVGLKEDILEWRGYPAQPADFDE